MAKKTIEIPIFYGSQTGNSEQAAEDFAAKLPSELSTSTLTITSQAVQLDDFLEVRKANWPQLFVVICSSYGVGQAPLGAWKFRELCDLILEGKSDGEEFLNGLQYAMLGLGDSKYTTFFLNPSAIDSALAKSGARRVGSLGKADASGKEDKVQLKVIEKWCKDIIFDLQRAVKDIDRKLSSEEEEKKVEEMLEKARIGTGVLCKQIYGDDWEDKPITKGGSNDFLTTLIPIIIAILAAILFYLLK